MLDTLSEGLDLTTQKLTDTVKGSLRIRGLPLTLDAYNAPDVMTSRHFRQYRMPEFEKFYLPPSMRPFTSLSPVGRSGFVVDDNRGAILSVPSLNIDGTDYYLSIKGVGSSTSPFSQQLLGKSEICRLVEDTDLRQRIMDSEPEPPRYVTGELWLRGSPYGGQGLQHATTSMRVSEMADVTSIHGFRFAPLVKIVLLPEQLDAEIKKLFWYRRFGGRVVQETRLVPSNVRIYFHSGNTVGGSAASVFDLFGIDNNEKALQFLGNFVKSAIAFLTLFTRSLKSNEDGSFTGLDFYDVWLDKDAVLAPDGTIFFVDLEGLEWITIGKDKVREKIDDQIYRSLYEFMYAYEQIERERAARFGVVTDRKVQFEYLLREALSDDEIVRLERDGSSLNLVVDNILHEESITGRFPIIDK